MQLQQHTEQLERLDVKVCVVTFEQKFLVEAYVRETNVSWPILIDEQRTLYTAYGMHRGRIRDILGLRSWWIYLKLMLRGRRLHRAHGDVFQLGGDVLVDPAGIVRLHHVGSGPADRPAVESLLQVVRDAR